MNPQKSLIFIHGWGASCETFKPFYPHLKSEFIIYDLDLPGFGKEKINKAMSLKDYADFVRDFLGKNQIQNPIILGHSLGGAIAAKFALLYSERISKLILINAAVIRKPNLKTKIIRKSANLANLFLSQKIKNIILKILKLENSDYAEINNPILKETFKKIIDENLESNLPKIKTPTLIIWGDQDKETPLEHGRLTAKLIHNSQFHILKGGHFIFFDQPKKFIELIKNFINE
ncbi:alpha/beta hydrolase [Candidatus Wolfebacteria bacterium]|nr:alpha/beta hydrolase [Candidatus Wolfebacteria bacterium]